MNRNPKNIPLFPEIKIEYEEETDIIRKTMSTQVRKKDEQGFYRNWTVVDTAIVTQKTKKDGKDALLYDDSFRRFMISVALALYFTRLDSESDKIVFADGKQVFGEDEDQRPTEEILREGYLKRFFETALR